MGASIKLLPWRPAVLKQAERCEGNAVATGACKQCWLGRGISQIWALQKVAVLTSVFSQHLT